MKWMSPATERRHGWRKRRVDDSFDTMPDAAALVGFTEFKWSLACIRPTVVVA